MDKYKFGDFIYNKRKELGLTQEELGRKLNVTNKAVSKWETGETLPDIQLLADLAKILNVTIDELLTQRKPEFEKVVIRPKILPYVILGVLNTILIFLVIGLSVFLVYKPKEYLTIENADNYITINLCENIQLDGYQITIYGSINEIKEVDIEYLTLSISLQYFYINTNGNVSEILYVDRQYIYDGINSKFGLTFVPQYEINNFKQFRGINVLYEIVDIKGEVK